MKPDAVRLQVPVVAAAVIFPKEFIIENVDDSKKCTAKQREELFTLIVEQAISVGVGIIDHEMIDRINILASNNSGDAEGNREYEYSAGIYPN